MARTLPIPLGSTIVPHAEVADESNHVMFPGLRGIVSKESLPVRVVWAQEKLAANRERCCRVEC
jgi:hypothetical protein